jgi:HK97 family phage prohead protease
MVLDYKMGVTMKDYMLLPIEIKKYEKKEENGKEYYYIDGFASVYNNIDLGGDRVLPGFFSEDLVNRGAQRKALWQHDQKEPLGINTYTDSEKGLLFTAKLPADDVMVSGRLIPQLEMGTIEGASIGYSVIESKYNREKGCRDLIKGKLYESSFVTTPMNPDCIIYSVSKLQKSLEEDGENESLRDIANVLVKSLDMSLNECHKAVVPYKDYPIMESNPAWDKTKAAKQIRDKTGSGEKPGASYKNGFMYYDPENEDNYGGYKLPYVYVEDGSFKAVPKAIFAIAAALSGARGGVNIPEADKTKIKAQINKYYEKMDREPPFKGNKSFLNIDTIKAFEKRDYEKLFEEDNEIILSSSAKNYIVDKLCHGTESQENDEIIEKNNIIDELKELNKELDKSLKGEKQ